jgi:hypothetical protein
MLKEAQLALALDTLPNTSYFPTALGRYIRQYIEAIPSLQLVEDEFALYAHYSHGVPSYRLLIDTHLDHPGFVTNGQGEAIPIGTIATPDMVESINAHQGTIPVTFYDAGGGEVGKGHLQNLRVQHAQTVMQACVTSPVGKKLPPNIQAIPDVAAKQDGEKLLMRSADNLSVTAVALEYLQWLVRTQVSADVTIVFTKLEEVRQISATAIARRGRTPFGRLDDTMHIIVLEAGLVGSTSRTREITPPQELDYDSGVLIRVSDHELAYQQVGRRNLAEALMLHARDTTQVRTQHGPSIGNCNALSYIFFSPCPHVTSLMIPTCNKHNFDQDGHLTHETIAVEDIQSVRMLLQSATSLVQHEILPHRDQILLPERHFKSYHSKRVDSKKKALLGALAWATPRLRAEYLFPTSPVGYIQCSISSVRSRLGVQNHG